jgi:DNA-binding NarL/FixJ family response regulator
MPIPATILVVDDQPYVRRTIRSLLSRQPHWKIHEAKNGQVAVDLIRELKPQVVVMDIVMPEMNGIEAAYEISLRAPETRIVLISSHYTPEEAATLARLFGDGNFIPKSESATQLIPAISRLLPIESQALPPVHQESAPRARRSDAGNTDAE